MRSLGFTEPSVDAKLAGFVDVHVQHQPVARPAHAANVRRAPVPAFAVSTHCDSAHVLTPAALGRETFGAEVAASCACECGLPPALNAKFSLITVLNVDRKRGPGELQ